MITPQREFYYNNLQTHGSAIYADHHAAVTLVVIEQEKPIIWHSFTLTPENYSFRQGIDDCVSQLVPLMLQAIQLLQR